MTLGTSPSTDRYSVLTGNSPDQRTSAHEGDSVPSRLGGADSYPARRHRQRTKPVSARTNGTQGSRIGLGVKFGAVTAILVLVVASITIGLQLQANSITSEYDSLLATQVSQSLQARKIQVEFKKQVQEWKDILLRGFNQADLATYTGNFRSEDALVNQLTTTLIAAVKDPTTHSQMIQFRTEHAQLDAAYQDADAHFVGSGGHDYVGTDRMVRGKDRPPTDLLDQVVTHLEQSTTAAIAARKASVATRQRLVLEVGSVSGLLVLVLLGLVVWRVVRPLRYLTVAADRVAHETLPAVIERIKSLPEGAEPPELPPFDVSTRDEVRDLSRALNRLQSRAVELAVGQHRAEREAADMLINLGRRNQNLLSRLLTQVTALERSEQDPDVLAQLFRLDHAATRIRRNAESMLVLAGASQTRTYTRPVPCADVIRAALSEIEDYARVDLYHVEDAEIGGSAAADVVHLLAELVENATHLSPPSTQVTVVGQRLREEYRIRIIDLGVGMTQRELTEANERIRQAASGWSDTKLLGLYVVGRLAMRWGISVTLEAGAARGTTASVLLPHAVLDQSRTAAGAVQELIPVTGPDGPRPSLPGGSRQPATRSARPPVAPVAAQLAPPVAQQSPPRPAVSGQVIRPGTGAYTAPPQASKVVNGPALLSGSGGSGFPGGATPRQSVPIRFADASGPRLPTRVRGAQLAELGLEDALPEVTFDVAPESSQWQLRSFQRDVDAARKLLAEQGGVRPGEVDDRGGPLGSQPEGSA